MEPISITSMLELAIVIGVIALLDWLWSYIEPYVRKFTSHVTKYMDRINHIEEALAPSIIPA